ncbi:MAG: hypothetical protein L7F78_10800, partial [Syntrophales bacterium LBB04]|nr:hypothetical protein [Syntrophales bacterium LBB04]
MVTVNPTISFDAAALCYLFALSFFRWQRLNFFVLLCGFALHTFFQVYRSVYLGAFLPINLVESAYFLPWCLALFSLAGRLSTGKRSLYRSLLMPVCLVTLPAFFFPRGILPPSPKTDAIVVTLFFLFEGVAH